MSDASSLKTAGALALALLLPAPALLAADPGQSDQKQETSVMYLGKVPVVGDKNIFLTLQSIKVALMRPVSSSAQDADLVVCRIDRGMSEALEYLDCDTNRDLSKLRDATQLSYLQAMGKGAGYSNSISEMANQIELTEELMFQNLIYIQPNHRLHIPINGGNLRKLLDSLPMPSPDQATAAAPVAATVAAPAAASSTPTGGPAGHGRRPKAAD